METQTMGKVLVTAKLENIVDLELRERGILPADQVRTVEVTDALVDTGATGLLVPKRLVAQLGLRKFRTRPARGIGGTVEMPMYGTLRLTIQGRDCAMDIGEIDDALHVHIGKIPLHSLDWVVDPARQRLIGNPDHGGEHVMEVF